MFLQKENKQEQEIIDTIVKGLTEVVFLLFDDIGKTNFEKMY